MKNYILCEGICGNCIRRYLCKSTAVSVRKIRPGSRKNTSWRILKLKKECVTFSEKLTKKEKQVQIMITKATVET